MSSMNNRFLSAETVIESLRDNGYSSTASALAELIDNSLQAKATRVEVGFIEEKRENKNSHAVSEISLWDNGAGMSPETLMLAMQFGGSENRNDANGMGRFGMGLPNSSISQCKRVEVWSWQEGNYPYFTYLDVDEMKSGELENVPVPVQKEIPEKYKDIFFQKPPKSGTLVLWSKLDRLSWKTGKSIYRHCEHQVGRMYRNFINGDDVKVESIIYRKSGEDKLSVWERLPFKANDPMYLMKKTSLPDLPKSYKNEAFFEKSDEESVEVGFTGEDGELITDKVIIRSSIVKNSIAKKILKESTSRLGSTVWGKHCEKNVGVSIVRANRELVIRNEFLPKSLRESKGRFIGVEVEFPPSLDAIFGVTNNKQDAVKLIPYDMKTISSQAGFDSEQEYKRDLEENEDSLVQVFRVIEAIQTQISARAKDLEGINIEPKGVKGVNNSAGGAAGKATAGSGHRESHGHKTEGYDTKLEKKDVVEHLTQDAGMSKEEAEKQADVIVETEQRYLIESVARDSEAFFDVSTRKGLTLVLFNSNHVFYRKLLSQLPEKELEVMQTAIAGFARVMNETTDERRLAFLNTIRREWGLVISEFLEEPSDDHDDF